MDRADEGAKFWLRVMNELKNRGVADILAPVRYWDITDIR